MQRVTAVRGAAEVDPARIIDRVVLDADDRQRRRIVLTGEKGTRLLLDFEKPVTLRDGDGLVLEDGSIVVVAGQAEPLVEISAKAPPDLVRLAWHIGNRHTDAQFADKAFPHPARSCAGGDGEGPRRDAPRSSRRRSIPSPPRRMAAIITIMTERSGRGCALSADGLALAGLSGRCVLLFGRDRMGGRERRHQGCRKPEALAGRDDRRGRRVLRCGVLRARASGDRSRTTTRRCATSPSLRPRSRRRRSAIWRRPRRAAPSSRRRARPGPARRSTGSRRPGTGRSPIRSRSASRRPGTASRSSRRSTPSCMP